MSDQDNPFFRGEGAGERLERFRASTPDTAVLTVHPRFAPGLEKQIPNFDSDETLEMVLRFPGLPDAIGGAIRGMQSYNRWLYYGELEGGVPRGWHYNRMTPADFVRDYQELVGGVLGRAVEAHFSNERIEHLNLPQAVKLAHPISPLAVGQITRMFLMNGRALLNGAIVFENQQQLDQTLFEIQSAYGIIPELRPPSQNAQIHAFKPEELRIWLSKHTHLLPPLLRPDALLDILRPIPPAVPFDLIVFDFDNTLAFTTPLKAFRAETPATGEPWDTCMKDTPANQEVRAWIRGLRSDAGKPKLAVISKAPRWYLDALLQQCYPGLQFDAVLGHDEARAAGHKYKPHPALLQGLMQEFGVTPDRTLVIGDEDDDIEMAYRAGVRALMVDFYSLATTRHLEEEFRKQQRLKPDPKAIQPKDWTYFNALETLPHAVCTAPSTLGDVAAHLPLHELPLEAALAGTPLDQMRRDHKHFKVRCFSRVRKGSPGLPIIVLGRYFTAPSEEKGIHVLPVRDGHRLTHQILEKEHGLVEVPEVWIEVVAWALRNLAKTQPQKLLVTIIPAKAQRPQRLENLLQRVQEKLVEDGENLQFNPAVFQFTQDAQSNKTLNSEERAANLERSLGLHPDFQPPAGHTYVVIDDVTTTGSTFLRARELLEARGVRSAAVQALAIAKTVGFRDRSRP